MQGRSKHRLLWVSDFNFLLINGYAINKILLLNLLQKLIFIDAVQLQ